MGHHEAHVGGQDGRPYVAGPVGAGECAQVLGQGRHTEGLVKDSAVLVPVAKRVPAGGPDQGEGDTSLSHGRCVQEARACCWGASRLRAFMHHSPSRVLPAQPLHMFVEWTRSSISSDGGTLVESRPAPVTAAKYCPGNKPVLPRVSLLPSEESRRLLGDSLSHFRRVSLGMTEVCESKGLTSYSNLCELGMLSLKQSEIQKYTIQSRDTETINAFVTTVNIKTLE